MWSFDHTETTPATPAQLWALYTDVPGWPQWDQGAAEVTIDGPLQAGARGRLKPVKGPASAFTVTEATPERGFTDVTRLPLARLTFTHVIAPDGTGSRITHRVTLRGPLAPVFARVVGRGIAAGMPTAMRALARLAETSPLPEASTP